MRNSLLFLVSLSIGAPRGACERRDESASTTPSATVSASPSAPAPAAPPAAAPAPAPASASADTKEYCKKMYGKAYMLCHRDDRDCKFLAADKWDRCQQTGRWP